MALQACVQGVRAQPRLHMRRLSASRPARLPIEADADALPTSAADIPPWHQLTPLFDDSWFIDCDLEVAMRRVIARQMGHGRAQRDVVHRVNSNDRPNAELIMQTAPRAELLVSGPDEHTPAF